MEELKTLTPDEVQWNMAYNADKFLITRYGWVEPVKGVLWSFARHMLYYILSTIGREKYIYIKNNETLEYHIYLR